MDNKNQTTPVEISPAKTADPSKKHISKKMFGLVMLALLVIIAGLFLAWKYIAKVKNATAPSSQNSSLNTKPDVNDPLVQKSALLSKVSQQVPAAGKSETIELSALPQELSGIIPKDAEGLVLKKDNYESGKVGYSIGYQFSKTMRDSYNALFRTTGGWEIISSRISSLAAVLEEENQRYYFQAVLQADSGKVLTNIRIVQK